MTIEPISSVMTVQGLQRSRRGLLYCQSKEAGDQRLQRCTGCRVCGQNHQCGGEFSGKGKCGRR